MDTDTSIPNAETQEIGQKSNQDSTDTQISADATVTNEQVNGDSAKADTKDDELERIRREHANSERVKFELAKAQVAKDDRLIHDLYKADPRMADKIVHSLTEGKVKNYNDLIAVAAQIEEEDKLKEQVSTSVDPVLAEKVIRLEQQLKQREDYEIQKETNLISERFIAAHPALSAENDPSGENLAKLQKELLLLDKTIPIEMALEKAYVLTGLSHEDDKKFLRSTEKQLGSLPSSSGTFVPTGEVSEEARRIASASGANPESVQKMLDKSYSHIKIDF